MDQRHLRFPFPELTSYLTNTERGFVIGGNVCKWTNSQQIKLIEHLSDEPGMGKEEQGGRDCAALLPGPREKGKHSGHWRHAAFLNIGWQVQIPSNP